MKNLLLISFLASFLWSCQKDTNQGPMPASDVLEKGKAGETITLQSEAGENATDRTDDAPQGCDCIFEVTSATPANGFGTWFIDLFYDADPNPEWGTSAAGDPHRFYLISGNCLKVVHNVINSTGAPVTINWRVTCNGNRVANHSVSVPNGQNLPNYRVDVCLDENCNPSILTPD